MSFAFSAVSIGSIKWLHYSSLLLLRRWKDHLLPRKALATRSAKALQSAAPFATGCRCDGAVQSSGPSPNKNGNLPAYILPARRTCSGSAAARRVRAANSRPHGRGGRAAAAAANIDQLIQAYTAEHTGRDRQIQSYTSRYEFHIKSYVTVCHAEIQADTDKKNCYIRSYGHVCSTISASTYNQIQPNTSKYKKPVNSYLHVCACIWHSNTRHTGTYESLVEFDIY